MIIRDARKLSPQALEELRRRAVAAVESGMTRVDVARLLGLSRQTVSEWTKAYRLRGEAAFRPKKRGRRPGEQWLLGPAQQTGIIETVIDHRPDQLGLCHALWCRRTVAELIKRRCRVTLSHAVVGKYLRVWGFTLPNPQRAALARNPEATRRWLTTEYPAILRAARIEGAELLWIDHGRTALTGQSRAGPAERLECGVLVAMSRRRQTLFAVHSGALDAVALHDFLGRLLTQVGRKTYAVIDPHLISDHRSLRTWLDDEGTGLVVHLLPT